MRTAGTLEEYRADAINSAAQMLDYLYSAGPFELAEAARLAAEHAADFSRHASDRATAKKAARLFRSLAKD